MTEKEEVQKLIFWRDGNGSRGAEERLQLVENKKQDVEACQTTTGHILDKLEAIEGKGRNTWLIAKDILLIVIAISSLLYAFITVG